MKKYLQWRYATIHIPKGTPITRCCDLLKETALVDLTVRSKIIVKADRRVYRVDPSGQQWVFNKGAYAYTVNAPLVVEEDAE